MKDLLKLEINEKGTLVLIMPNGEVLPGMREIKCDQEFEMLRSGHATVTVSLLVKTKPDPKPREEPSMADLQEVSKVFTNANLIELNLTTDKSNL